MFSFISIFSPGVITFFVSEKCTRQKANNGLRILLELTAYSALDSAAVVLLLEPLGRASIISTLNGDPVLSYGSTAYLFSFLIAFIMGIVIAAVKKRIALNLHITPKEDSTNVDQKMH